MTTGDVARATGIPQQTLISWDRSGVLNKVFMLIRRKMINVDTITACATQQPGISRITLTLREDSDDKALQLVKQMEKLTEVISLMIDNFMAEIGPDKIIEVARSGFTAMEK